MAKFAKLLKNTSGFSLIEVLVIIVLIIVLIVIAVSIYSGIQNSTKDAKRKADIEAIAKIQEIKRSPSGIYPTLVPNDFTSAAIPQKPEGGNYDISYTADATAFRVCAALEGNSAPSCNSPSSTCYCKTSIWGNYIAGADINSTPTPAGSGGGSSLCDTSNGLIGYWPMDETSGNTVGDLTTNNYSGTAAGTTIAAGKFGNARNFTSNSSDAVTFSPTYTGLDNLPNFTYSLWVKPAGLPGAGMLGMQGWWLMGKNNTFIMTTTSSDGLDVGKIGAGVPFIPSPGGSILITTTSLVADNWQHVVMVFSSTNAGGNITGGIKIYINSVEASYNLNVPGMGTGLMGDAGFPLAVGNSGALDVPFNGSIDDVRVYNRALSPQEISTLYGTGAGCGP